MHHALSYPLQLREGAFLPTDELTPILLKCRSPRSLDNGFLYIPFEEQKGLWRYLLTYLRKAEKMRKPAGTGGPQYL